MDKLKVGDKVYYYCSRPGGWGIYHFLTIERETPTRWVTTGGTQWHKKNLQEVGRGDWSFNRIALVTPEVEAVYAKQQERINRQKLWRQIQEMKCPDIALTRLEEIFKELKGE